MARPQAAHRSAALELQAPRRARRAAARGARQRGRAGARRTPADAREVIDAQREALLAMRDRGAIDDDALRNIERELDLEEIRMEA